MGVRRRARELTLQLLYQRELTHAEPVEMQAHFEEWKSSSEGVRSFATRLLDGVLNNIEEIDRELGAQTAHWRLDRLAAVDRNILRLAFFELLYQQETPPAVVIDEAIEIAKRFGSGESARFVNGVLDGFLKRRRRPS